ncbi:hypothetical protein GCM10025857_31660 [Alicyclobacillus contaminans]|nr:hypothetical protein GCM10025857_31660 [Alicyclobacillus contaminans]
MEEIAMDELKENLQLILHELELLNEKFESLDKRMENHLNEICVVLNGKSTVKMF